MGYLIQLTALDSEYTAQQSQALLVHRTFSPSPSPQSRSACCEMLTSFGLFVSLYFPPRSLKPPQNRMCFPHFVGTSIPEHAVVCERDR